ncbi:MAG: GNAT family N-acetyltransferase [candidate division WOR-3 bacterium]|nr:MAG: GNAT family N-acetyltransferase [candidate division WOR-3 bacterium]
MDIVKLAEKDHKHWEEFVASADNGTIFHSLQFLQYHPPDRFIDHHLIIKDRNNIAALFPAVIEGDTIVSHKGSSYGGFVLREGLGIHTIYLIVEHVIQYLKSHGFNRIVLTQPPLIYYRNPNQYIEFALMKNNFEYLKRDVTAVIALDSAEPLATFHSDARRSTKKAIREGVRVRISSDFSRFYEILRHNLGMRHNVIPTHSLDELTKLKKIFPERIILFGAYIKEKMVGGMVIFVTNPRVILAFYISHDDSYQKYRPVNLLFYEVIRWGRTQGFKYLDLGTFTLNMAPNWGLGRFKENFAARGFLRDTYQLIV